jgi:hypothetical protein
MAQFYAATWPGFAPPLTGLLLANSGLNHHTELTAALPLKADIPGGCWNLIFYG